VGRVRRDRRGVRARHRERPLASVFLCTAFILHYVVWSWIGRTLFQYHYLPSLYASLLALGMTLGMLWRAPATTASGSAPACAAGASPPDAHGTVPADGHPDVGGGRRRYGAAVVYRRLPTFQWPPGRVVVVAYGPSRSRCSSISTRSGPGMPIARDTYSARMWFQNGPARWILRRGRAGSPPCA
jgi:hypothetical protein